MRVLCGTLSEERTLIPIRRTVRKSFAHTVTDDLIGESRNTKGVPLAITEIEQADKDVETERSEPDETDRDDVE
ncbi:hypothetical protein [Oleiagrimonas soli]|uniref:Uncharacterized protein n=1 Tax=Oleiagrimonas soli TaxID=1543381 RepID=A0A841KE69_9GAMM|nr:hypothetical protein [Oleiagrimonas soli]MBB6183280.1 hypothetical protein [Oleiagrimonas soli]